MVPKTVVTCFWNDKVWFGKCMKNISLSVAGKDNEETLWPTIVLLLLRMQCQGRRKKRVCISLVHEVHGRFAQFAGIFGLRFV